jgi:hypothetical protein
VTSGRVPRAEVGGTSRRGGRPGRGGRSRSAAGHGRNHPAWSGRFGELGVAEPATATGTVVAFRVALDAHRPAHEAPGVRLHGGTIAGVGAAATVSTRKTKSFEVGAHQRRDLEARPAPPRARRRSSPPAARAAGARRTCTPGPAPRDAATSALGAQNHSRSAGGIARRRPRTGRGSASRRREWVSSACFGPIAGGGVARDPDAKVRPEIGADVVGGRRVREASCEQAAPPPKRGDGSAISTPGFLTRGARREGVSSDGASGAGALASGALPRAPSAAPSLPRHGGAGQPPRRGHGAACAMGAGEPGGSAGG